MGLVFYVILFFAIVPIQVTILNNVSPWGIQPDLCLVVTCLTGFLSGQGRGCGVGIGLGFLQDSFSGGGDLINLLTKGLAGFLSGLFAKTLSSTTSSAIFLPTFILSCLCGLISLTSARPHTDWMLLLHEFRLILLPQGLLDAFFAFGIHWVMSKMNVITSVLEPSN